MVRFPSFAREIKLSRTARSLSQVQVAERTGLGRVTVQYWELGKKSPDLTSLAKFCLGLGVGKRERSRFLEAMMDDLR